MQLWWVGVQCVLVAMLALVHFASVYPSSQTTQQKCAVPPEFTRFQHQYLVVYGVVMFADWLQGTHMYTLYQSYGVDIGSLFLIGFLSSALFGTVVGWFADRFGRKRACVVYCLLEVVVNLLEHSTRFSTLVVGRILGGISTSLLFCAFEGWMVTEHHKRGFDEQWLAETFARASTLNGAAAIVAGMTAHFAVAIVGDDIAPFQLAIVLTLVALGLVVTQWPENFGMRSSPSSEQNLSLFAPLASALRQPAVLRVGLISALFEGAMFTFVFLWVPVLQQPWPAGTALPTGLIFSSLMTCISLGGAVFGVISARFGAHSTHANDHMFLLSSRIMLGLLCVSSVALLVAAAHAGDSFAPVLCAFLLFEACVGVYHATIGAMRGHVFPDAVMSSLLSAFRVPLNALVVSGTLMADRLPDWVVLLACSGCLCVAAVVCGPLALGNTNSPHKPKDL